MRFAFAVVLISVLQIGGCDLTGGSAKVQKEADWEKQRLKRLLSSWRKSAESNVCSRLGTSL